MQRFLTKMFYNYNNNNNNNKFYFVTEDTLHTQIHTLNNMTRKPKIETIRLIEALDSS